MRITTLTAGLRRVIGFLPFYLFPVLPLSAQPAGVTLDTLHIRHIDFHGKSQTGILICNKSISKDLQEIFAELRGLAIDVNPLYNPCVRRKKDGTLLIQPATGKPYVDRSKKFKYKITKRDLCYRLFVQHGFKWGGNWQTVKDYQHFEKP